MFKYAGSCWAFTAVAAIESVVKIRKGVLLDLSEQELVDCVTTCYKCEGGWPDKAFQWVISNKGIATEAYYPYTATSNNCNVQRASNCAVSITSYRYVGQDNEVSLMNVVATQPVVVAIDARGNSFQNYKGGIYTGPCGTNLTHALVIVGYDDGYMYIQRESPYDQPRGLCGLASLLVVPTIASPRADA
ncbi:Ervatamin-B [Carex littledalei]|uniref:Ervatamin-B n=1 Tax=Carex littledalei TaxID=544730 RepID=A0A833QRP9_9POAL|nr:Ervatamin-B [Carex littledalei]